MDENVIELKGIPSTGAAGGFTIQWRGYLSTQHLWAAEHFTRLAAGCEAAHTGEPEFSIRHRAYVLAAVGEAVAFLEAFINELFQDAKDATDGVAGAATAIKGFPPDTVRLMAAYWNSTRDGESVQAIRKYDAARVFAGRPRSDAGRLPHQDLERVIKLRNWSVHYRPQTFSHDEPDRRIEDARSRIAENALMAGSNNPWFPDEALGAGCGHWAVRTVREFVDEFVAAVGCVATYRDFNLYGDEQP